MENSNKKIKNVIKFILIFITIIVVAWFGLVIYEYYRVKIDKRPLICLHEKSDTEGINEYSKTCYGILYKYREYYTIDGDQMTAREFTLSFKEFKRKVDNK